MGRCLLASVVLRGQRWGYEHGYCVKIDRIRTGITGKEKHSLFRGRSPFLFLLLYVVQNILTMEPPDIATLKPGISPLSANLVTVRGVTPNISATAFVSIGLSVATEHTQPPFTQITQNKVT
jgi:hypothetical protein